jgi:hypothetical protein
MDVLCNATERREQGTSSGSEVEDALVWLERSQAEYVAVALPKNPTNQRIAMRVGGNRHLVEIMAIEGRARLDECVDFVSAYWLNDRGLGECSRGYRTHD